MSTFRQWHLLGARRIELVDVERPVVASGQALVRILGATTCGTDLKVFQAGGHARMLQPPCPFGHEMVGVLEEIGADFDTPHRTGTRVVVANSSPCGACRPCLLGRENLCADLRYVNGAFGELLLLDERFARSLHPVPEALPTEHACLAEPLACALHCIEQLQPFLDRFSSRLPARAIVMGAGPLGLLLTALLSDDPVEVTSVDPNPERLELAADLGAGSSVRYHRVIDDLEAHRARYDLAIDASGTTQGWRNAIAAVAHGGEAVLFGGIPGGAEIGIDAHRVHYGEIVIRGLYHHRPDLFPRALEWLRARPEVARRLIDRHDDLAGLPRALDDMERRRVLKVALQIGS